MGMMGFPNDIKEIIRKILYKYRTITKINRSYYAKYYAHGSNKVFFKYGSVAFNYRTFPIKDWDGNHNIFHYDKCLNILLPKNY